MNRITSPVEPIVTHTTRSFAPSNTKVTNKNRSLLIILLLIIVFGLFIFQLYLLSPSSSTNNEFNQQQENNKPDNLQNFEVIKKNSKENPIQIINTNNNNNEKTKKEEEEDSLIIRQREINDNKIITNTENTISNTNNNNNIEISTTTTTIRRTKTNGEYNIAILMPFVARQLPKLFFNWNRWGFRNEKSRIYTSYKDYNPTKAFPCSSFLTNHLYKRSGVNIKAKVTYVMLYNQDFDSPIRPNGRELSKEDDASKKPLESISNYNELSGLEVKNILNREWERLEGKTCFNGGIQFLSAHTPKIHDKHPEGPCYMYFTAMELLKKDYDYFFLMEPDVTPIRDHWLDKIVNETIFVQDDFWMKGSMSRCPSKYGAIAERQDFHINGNALYKLGEPKFEEYIEKVKIFYPVGNDGLTLAGCATGLAYEGGYDHTMYRFRFHPHNFDYVKNFLHRFVYNEFVQNRCEETYDPEEVKKEFPETYLVHSKAVFYTPEEITYRNIYTEIIGTPPNLSTDESRILIEKIREGSITEASLKLLTCLKTEYAEKAQFGYVHPFCIELCQDLRFQRKFERKLPNGCAGYNRNEWKNKFKDKLYLWTSDFHAAPIGCNMDILKEADIEPHAEVDFGNCMFFKGTCKQRLKVLSFDDWKGFSLDPCPNQMRRAFFNAYKYDPEMERVDAVICSHPVANCELYMPLNKSLIIYATTRIEFGRDDKHVEWRKPYITSASNLRWKQWIDELVRIGKNPRNVIAANNMYDAHYIKYHTGLDAEYIPSWCGDSGVSYNPKRTEILLGPYRDNLDYPRFDEEEAWKHPIMRALTVSITSSGTKLKFIRLRQEYPQYKLEDLANHPALVYIPYQVSTMSFFEMYRLNIPMFVPSKALLIKWHIKYNNMFERIYGEPERVIFTEDEKLDPNSNTYENLNYWLDFCDFYVFPHVTTFNSWAELIEKLESVDLKQISNNMKEFNKKQKEDLKETWSRIKTKILKYSGGPGNSKIPPTFEDGLKLYGLPPLGLDIVVSGKSQCPYE
ncbi:hypothetical protein ABK040_010101 [Willaertia magna]